MNNLSCTCGCGCPYTNYRDQKNKAYDAEFVATLVSKTPKDHWHNEMYLTIFKNGLVMDGVKYKESIYSPNGCPIVQAIPKSHQKSIKRHVISLNDAAFRDIKTLVRKCERFRHGGPPLPVDISAISVKPGNISVPPVNDENQIPCKRELVVQPRDRSPSSHSTLQTIEPLVKSSNRRTLDEFETLERRVLSLEEMVQSLRRAEANKVKCLSHRDHDMCLYCRLCNEVICIKCMVDTHMLHQMADIRTHVLETLGDSDIHHGWFVSKRGYSLVPLTGHPSQVVADIAKECDVHGKFTVMTMSVDGCGIPHPLFSASYNNAVEDLPFVDDLLPKCCTDGTTVGPDVANAVGIWVVDVDTDNIADLCISKGISSGSVFQIIE
eukprot:GHVH01000354.1.p1 GENE.GHVH01000354.1~~GHVH01000354.1.p1  ORF type:complete len:390 (+),score=39.00 GHVH01000354.1:33-1172(+)